MVHQPFFYICTCLETVEPENFLTWIKLDTPQIDLKLGLITDESIIGATQGEYATWRGENGW
jgi:hypothetical protein